VPSAEQARSELLKKKVAGVDLVVVRSQEIDFFGEGGFGFQARSVMDTVVDNLARAVRKLAAIGVARAVLASDHGHLFAAEPKPESMRIDSPGGDTVDLHRRCWAGRGGATPSSCVRVPARDLGHDADFDFVFPSGAGVLRAGGDLAFHHGGPSLQELVIPVITFRTAKSSEREVGGADLIVSDAPSVITNRMFSVKLSYASLLGSGAPVRPVLLSGGRQVGAVGMVFGAEEQDDGTVALHPGSSASIGFMLQDDTVDALRIVVLDPATDEPVPDEGWFAVTVVVDSNCQPTSGTWYSQFDGVTLTSASQVDIDHQVPLAEAWRSGARSWTTDRRRAFANDLTWPQLIAVSASSNRSKGDQDPKYWKPRAAFHCTYSRMWIRVKYRYDLTVDSGEKSALQTMLNTC
jgi:hypothetical protein